MAKAKTAGGKIVAKGDCLLSKVAWNIAEISEIKRSEKKSEENEEKWKKKAIERKRGEKLIS